MRKTKYTLAVVLLLGLFLLAGCGPKNQNKEVNSGTENTELTSQTSTESEMLAESEKSDESEVVTETEAPEETTVPSETEEVTESETTVEPPEEPQRYVVNTETVNETVGTEPFKYGVTKTTSVKKTYNIYNDGSRELIDEYSYSTYDTSGYNATDDELQAEVEALVNANMAYYEEVVRLVNEIRAEVGAAPVELDLTLCKAATMRSVEMTYAQYFEHRRADGRSCFTAIDYYGYQSLADGENIGVGQETASYVVERWKNSPGHYQNMIRPQFNKLGVGFCDVPLGTKYQRFWTQLFAYEYIYVEPDWDAWEE